MDAVRKRCNMNGAQGRDKMMICAKKLAPESDVGGAGATTNKQEQHTTGHQSTYGLFSKGCDDDEGDRKRKRLLSTPKTARRR